MSAKENEEINKTVEEATDETNLYKGLVANNYISFSGMLFRIIGLDGNNVKIITDKFTGRSKGFG